MKHHLADIPIFLDPVPFGDDPARQRFLLLRYGRTDCTKGAERSFFEFDERDADAVIADFAERGKDLVMDYDHATVRDLPEAPAAGWIRRLSKEPDGLYADVEWTERAAAFLKAREYRYHSPVIYFDRKTGHPLRLHSVALTNHPAMHSYPPLVADDSTLNQQDTPTMNEHIKALAERLGIAIATLDDGTEDEKATAQAIGAKLDEMAAQAKSAADFLALHGAKTFDDVTGKIAGMVPASEKAELEAKLAAMNAEKAVAAALNDGRLVEAQKAWALDYAARNPQGFSDFVKASPKVAPGPASMVPAGTPPKASDAEGEAYSDEDLMIAARMGVTAEDLKKYKD